MHSKSDNLLIVTVAGRIRWLKGAIETLRDPLDVLVVDDATPGNEIRDFCQEKGLAYITKPKPKGLTNSWNEGFKFFRENKYKRCILSNDDVRFPKGFSRGLLAGTDNFTVACPICNMPTRKKNLNRLQWLFRYTELPPKKIDAIQQLLEKKYIKSPYTQTSDFNGFCFAFSNNICKYVFSDTKLFDPKHINIKNENELEKRIRKRRGTIAVCRTSYVFHFKAGTYGELHLKNRDCLWR